MDTHIKRIIADKPFMLKLFLSFLFLASIMVICVNIFNYWMVLYFYKNELAKAYGENLKVADTVFRIWDNEIKNQVLTISMNENLNTLDQRLNSFEKVPDYKLFSSLIKLSSDLKNIVIANTRYYSISIIGETGDIIITSNHGALPIKDKNGDIHADYRDIFMDNYNGLNRYSLSIRDAAQKFHGETVITYIAPLMSYVTNTKGVILFDLQERELSRIINGGMEKATGNIFIINDEGVAISDTNKDNIGADLSSLPAVKIILDSRDTSGFFISTIDGKKCFINYLKSNLNDWYYCSFIPINDLTARTRILFIFTIILITGFLALSVPLSYILAKKINIPLKRIISRMKNNDKISSVERINELDQISIAMDNFTRKIEKDEKIISEYYLLQLLSGSSDRHQEDIFRNPFEEPYLRCIVISPDSYSRLVEQYGTEPVKSLQDQILSKCIEHLSNIFVCYGVISGKNAIAIINFREMDADFLKSILLNIQHDIAGGINSTVSIGVGIICQTQDVHSAYNTACRALTRRLVLGRECLSFYLPEIVRDYYYPYDKEKIIFNHLRLNNLDNAMIALDDFFEELENIADISIDNITMIFNQLTGEIIKYLMELKISSRDVFAAEIDLYHQLARFDFTDEYKIFFHDILGKIISYQLKKNIHRVEHITRILDYINMNYDKKFDINTLSDHVGLSYSHVRRVFIEKMGVSILNYVYRKKVDVSKEILLNTNMKIDELVQKLGFYNKQSFYHFFKKFEKVTPQEYRIFGRGGYRNGE